MIDELNKGRSRVIDVVQGEQQSNNGRVKRRKKKPSGRGRNSSSNESGRAHDPDVDTNLCDGKDYSEKLPVEMTPVIEAIKQYARRTYSIGALQGASAIDNLAKKIKQLSDQPGSLELEKLWKDATLMSDELRSYVKHVYED